MQYLIMVLIVFGMAATDFITGCIKAYCTNSVNSQKMRCGGLNKLCEVIVMMSICGLDVGVHALGNYYEAEVLGELIGAVTAVSVFVYITMMEVVSVLENFAAINPEAKWITKITGHFKFTNEKED